MKKDAKLFVGGLNPDTDEDVIKAYFERFGEVSFVPTGHGKIGYTFKLVFILVYF